MTDVSDPCADQMYAEVSLYATEGYDRDGAAAMLNQARLGPTRSASPIDDIQVLHLLQIGYRAPAGQSPTTTAASTGGTPD